MLHAADCTCSVCWVESLPAAAPLIACPNCVPRGEPYQLNGRWYCELGTPCFKHELSSRIPAYWFLESRTVSVPYLGASDDFSA